ncbi:F-box protein [Quillaja saponaria]|uniref:F-box protein n=1 Tax=Quillaja saponaria TaxID=32244 RepID=A0AAD7M3G5_QUISA|nr:F-box protein [Quillaja saponaria]
MISDPKLIMNTQKLVLVSPASMQVMEYNGCQGNARKVQFGPLLNSRESKKLTTVELGWYSYFGFGYDHSSDDYKIVNLRQYIGGAIYSMRKSSWRYDREIPCSGANHDVRKKGGILANNALHWHATYKSKSLQTREGSCIIICSNGGVCVDNCGWTMHQVIYRFDLVDETGVLILPPDGTDTESGYEFMDFKGYLCLSQNQNGSCIEMWILRGENDQLNWIKLMSIPCLNWGWGIESLMPIHFSRNGDILLNIRPSDSIVYDSLRRPLKRMKTIFYSYNPIEQISKRVRIHGIRSWTSEITYSESLISLNQSNS